MQPQPPPMQRATAAAHAAKAGSRRPAWTPAGCAGWRLTWSVTGFTALTIQIEGSQNNSSWAAISSTLVQEGANPTNWTSATTSNTIVVRVYFPYVRVHLTGTTGSGTVKTFLLGYAGTSAQMDLGGGSVTFDKIASGTNTTAHMTVGSGAILDSSGTGRVQANAIRAYTVATLPSPAVVGQQAYVTDGATNHDCVTGLGTFAVLCGFNGSSWVPEGGGGSFADLTSGTNVQAAMLVGTGASLAPTGSGTVTASGAASVPALCPAGQYPLGVDSSFNAAGCTRIPSGGVTVFSRELVTFSTTSFFPIGGGSLPSATEADVQVAAPIALSVSSCFVSLSAAPGAGSSIVFTWRKAGSSQSLTCMISGASATGCSDIAHSFTAVQGDLLDIQAVVSGTPVAVTPVVTLAANFQGSGGGGGVTGTYGEIGAINSSGALAAAPSLVDLLGVGLPGGTMGNEVHKNLVIANGVSSTLLHSVTGPGYISELFIATDQYATEVIVTVDGEATPSIDANIADLLGSAYADTQPASFNRWITVSNNGPGNIGGTLKIPIPFSSSVVVQVKNNSGASLTLTSHIIYHTGIPDNWANTQRLKISVVNISGIAANAETNMLNVTPNKPGRLFGVGWLYDGFPGSATPRTAPLEGAFKIYIDGSGTPNYATGGSEDFFGAPWYFNNTTVFGNTATNTLAPASADTSITTESANTWGAQRFFAQDPVTFTTAVRFTWTCGNTSAVNFTGTCTLRSSVYYYQQN